MFKTHFLCPERPAGPSTGRHLFVSVESPGGGFRRDPRLLGGWEADAYHIPNLHTQSLSTVLEGSHHKAVWGLGR